MKKRWIALAIAAIMLTTILCGCKEDAGQAGEGNQQDRLQASLVISCQEEEAVLKVINDRIAKFQTQFPGVQVTLDATGEAAANILCASGDQLAAYWKDGKLLDLDTFLEDGGLVLDAEGTMSTVGLTEEQLGDLVELYFEEGKQFEENAVFMLPLYRESLVLYCNETYMEENSLENPFSWETLEQICEQIKQLNPDAKPLVCKDVQGVFLSMCAQYGAEYTAAEGVKGLLASEGALEAAKKINSLYQKGYMTFEDLSLQDPGVCMVIDTSSNLQMPAGDGDAFSFEANVMTLPRPEELSGAVLSTGVSMGILRSDDDDQMLAAWLLTKALCTDVEFQAELAMVGSYTPVMTSVEIFEKYSDYLDQADGGDHVGALAALACMEQQHMLFAAPAYAGSLEEKEKLTALLTECAQAAEGVEAILEKGIG